MDASPASGAPSHSGPAPEIRAWSAGAEPEGGGVEGRPEARDPRRLSAADWHSMLGARGGDPVCSRERSRPFAVSVFALTPAAVEQPDLLDDVVCLHLGGPKRVHRRQGARASVHEVDVASVTVMPRHRGATWMTEGTIGYAHVIPQPRAFEAVIGSELGIAREDVSLDGPVGLANPILSGLLQEMCAVVGADASRLYCDTLFTAFALALLRHCSDRQDVPTLVGGTAACGGMAGWRLRRVVDFLHANLARDVSLEEITAASGLSRAHFFRAFRQATGLTPGRFLERLRVDSSRRAIEGGQALVEAAAASGFSSRDAMTRSFRRVIGTTPDLYKRWYG